MNWAITKKYKNSCISSYIIVVSLEKEDKRNENNYSNHGT